MYGLSRNKDEKERLGRAYDQEMELEAANESLKRYQISLAEANRSVNIAERILQELSRHVRYDHNNRMFIVIDEREYVLDCPTANERTNDVEKQTKAREKTETRKSDD